MAIVISQSQSSGVQEPQFNYDQWYNVVNAIRDLQDDPTQKQLQEDYEKDIANVIRDLQDNLCRSSYMRNMKRISLQSRGEGSVDKFSFSNLQTLLLTAVW